MLIIGKGEEQDQKMAAIKRVTYTFASASTAWYSVRQRFECPTDVIKYESIRMKELHNVGIVARYENCRTCLHGNNPI